MISCIIPTFNRSLLLLETLNSISNQTYTNWEVIVVDDGSIDDTEMRLNSIEDDRVHYYKRRDPFKKGPGGCRNFGLEKAQGELILFFDDDDIAHPELFIKVISAFKSKTFDFVRYERAVFYGDFHYKFDNCDNEKTFLIDINDIDKIVTNKLPFNTCSVVWKKDAIGNERFNESLFYSDEWEFFQRLLSKGINGISLNHTLIYARKHTKSSTGYFQDKKSKYYNSTRNAMILAVNNLKRRNILNSDLISFFLRKAFELKYYELLILSLKAGEFNRFNKMKYKIGYKIYPLLKPIFYLKGKILNN